MDDFVVIKGSDQMENSINSSNVTQKGISKSGSFRSSLDQTGDIDNLQDGRDNRRGFVYINQVLEFLVRDNGLNDVRLRKDEENIVRMESNIDH
jgi:hypothetical protein